MVSFTQCVVVSTSLLSLGLVGLRAAQAPVAVSESSAESFFDALDHPAIRYLTRQGDDAVTRFVRSLAAGDARLTFDAGTGYLRSLLEALDVPVASQMAVYSKTSLQAARIDPGHPRTIFFNDATVVAWPRGGFVEIAAQDPQQGMKFYQLEQRSDGAPRFAQSSRCLTCHHSYATAGVPGLFTRSIVTAPDGTTVPRLGNSTSDHRSPLAERWGGWYVTGNVGSAMHLGNTFVTAPLGNPDAESRRSFETPASLKTKFETDAYLSPYSDVAALLVFQHQTWMMNLLTRVGWSVRLALAERPAAVNAVADSEARELVDYLLFVDEAALPGRIRGTSGFAEQFSTRGPTDRRGRSLRQLDLERRLLRYPCSYMIYSDAFEALAARGEGCDLPANVDGPFRPGCRPEVPAADSRRPSGHRRDPPRDEARTTRLLRGFQSIAAGRGF